MEQHIMIITFCGHDSFTGAQEYEQKLLSLLQELIGDGQAELYLGEYGGFDAFAYECCKKFKSTHPNVKLIFITPYISPEYQKNHLEYQKNRYDQIIYPPLEGVPQKFAIAYRNRWMVRQADAVVSYIEHSWGGAYKTYKYAERNNKKIFNLYAQ